MPSPRRSLLALLAVTLQCTPGTPSTTSGEPTVSPDRGPATAPTQPEPADPPAPTDEPPPAAAPLPDAPAFVAGAFEVRTEKGKPKPPTKAFKRTHEGMDMQDHASVNGWTEDGSAFVYCELVSGEGCRQCSFTAPDGTTETLFSGSMCASSGTKVKAKALKERLAASKPMLRDTTWAHGGDLVVTARQTNGKPDSSGDARAILEVGAAPRGNTSPGVTAWEADACQRTKDGDACFFEAHADAIVPSPDGQHVAILAHMWAGEWSDTFTVAIVPAGRIAAAGYHRRGLDALAAGELEAAAEAFVAATHVDPAAWKGPYNLACAYARAADARAQTALRTAVERGGDAVRKKAARDKDLDTVRAEPWFAEIVTP